ncbi:MAG: hypothetical protein WBO24_04710 [Nitrospirales bacterium]
MNLLQNLLKSFLSLAQNILIVFQKSKRDAVVSDQRSQEPEFLPDEGHILRYVKPSAIDDGVIGGGAFLGRYVGDDPSVNWVECFPGVLNNQISEIRKKSRITYAATGRLARLNIGKTRSHVSEKTNNEHNLNVIKDALEANNNYEEDPSHALMKGVLSVDDIYGEFVGDLIAECIIDSFPAVAKNE